MAYAAVHGMLIMKCEEYRVMSVKVKMRCARCGKSFKSSGAKQTLCPDCEVKARNERAASKVAAPKVASPVATQAPKIVGPGASILVPGLVSPEVSVPQESGPFGRRQQERGAAGPATETRERVGAGPHAPHPPHAGHGAPAAPAGTQRSGPGAQSGHEKSRPPRPEGQRPQPKAQKEPKQPRPPTPPMELSDEQRQKVEQRYLELANPVEFDGIRTQIAGELGVPKALVKKTVQELRGRMQLPSWWELQSYTGGNSDLERIRRAYVPLLPVPEIGVHKKIAADLGLETTVVYQGIKRIRAEMRLPRYNPPELHESDRAGEEQTPLAEPGAAEQTPAAADSEVPVSAQSTETR